MASGDEIPTPDFLEKIGLDEHLSPTRKNGLSSLITAIKNIAKQKLN